MTFRQLYCQICEYNGRSLFTDVLESAIPFFRECLQQMQHLRGHSSCPSDEEFWDLYALSRVNDLLLISFQPVRAEPPQIAPVTLGEYCKFFLGLGFEISGPDRFTPFFHEIVEVEQVQSGSPVITALFWPVVRFGDLLFSRAGVKIRSGPESIDKYRAENSTLYFSFTRLNRPTSDLSHGWGSNSQWATRFRRDYVTAKTFYYNIDGVDDVRDPATYYTPETLSTEQRIELLRHRCWVLREPESDDEFPFMDRYTEVR